jgi:hypothetical protein
MFPSIFVQPFKPRWSHFGVFFPFVAKAFAYWSLMEGNMFFNFERFIYEEGTGIGVTMESFKVTRCSC